MRGTRKKVYHLEFEVWCLVEITSFVTAETFLTFSRLSVKRSSTPDYV